VLCDARGKLGTHATRGGRGPLIRAKALIKLPEVLIYQIYQKYQYSEISTRSRAQGTVADIYYLTLNIAYCTQ